MSPNQHRGRRNKSRLRKSRPMPTPPPQRLPEEESGDGRDMRLGQILVGDGAVQPVHLEECLKIQEDMVQQGTATSVRLGELLVRFGYARPEQIDQALEFQESSGRTCSACGEHCPAILLDMGDGNTCPHCGSRFLGRSAPIPVEEPPPAPVLLRPHHETAPVPLELEKLGKYELVREIGRGSMGVVFEAVDSSLNRKVALKLLHQRTGPDVQQFVKEAQLSANLPRHPNIVTVYEAGHLEGRHYIAMELLSGQPLSTWRKKGSVTIRHQVRLLRDVALAVHHAHEHGILHCDLKPQNVMVDDRKRPFVTDFGLARRAGLDTWATQETGWTAGTPAYMSPEQAQGRLHMDRRTDVYSLGVMLYETFTGRNPFRASTPEELLEKTVHERVRPPSAVARSLASTDPRKTVDAICLKALAKKPGQRYPTAKALADDLSRWLRGDEVRQGPLAPKRTVPGWAAALAVAAALVICIVIGRGVLAPESAPRPVAAAEPAPEPVRVEETRPSAEALERARAEQARKARAEKVAREIQARSEGASLGSIHPIEWLLASPFENRGIHAAHAPEQSIDLHAEMAGKAGPVRWQRAVAALNGGAALLDFARLSEPNSQAVAYALTHVKAPAALDAVLLVGSDDGVKVWVNGTAVHTRDVGRGVRIDEDHVRIRLLAGWNRLLFKVTRRNQGWGLAARIADADLRPIDGLEYDAQGDLPR